MKHYEVNGREVEIDRISGLEDDMCIEAYFCDTDEQQALTAEETQILIDTYPVELYEEWWQVQIARAEAEYERYEER